MQPDNFVQTDSLKKKLPLPFTDSFLRLADKKKWRPATTQKNWATLKSLTSRKILKQKMKHRKTKLTALLLLGIGFNQVYAQQASTASGGDASGSGGSVAYSVGQIVYTTNTGITGSVAQGVQQPYEISITTGMLETDIKLNLSAYPNPTTNYLMLQIDNYDKALLYQLYDISGKLLESNTIVASSTTITMEALPTATYLLKVTQNNKEVKTFKIMKN